MKTNFNQSGWREAVVRSAALLCTIVFPCLSFANLQMPVTPPDVTTLTAGATGLEIQAALDALPAAGGEVVLPAGRFEISRPIVLCRDHQTLRGSGPGTILCLADNANCPVIIMGEPVNHPRKMIKDLCVRDLFINGNRHCQQRELWRLKGEGSEIRNNGITVQSVADSLVKNVTCTRCRSGGLVTTLGVKHLTVRGLTAFDNEFDGLACYGTTQSLFVDLSLHDNPAAGISLDLAFNNNVISNAVLIANDLGIFMRASRKNKFYNIAIRHSRHYGVFMAHSEIQTPRGWGPAPSTECVNNAFTNLVAMNCGSAAFRVNNTTCTNNVIIRAKFEGNLKGDLSLAQPNLVLMQ